jgi:hypothetical protein
MNETEWKAFLTEYSRELLANEKVRKRLRPEVVESGWLGYTPASEEEIVAAETRLGVRFPPSYRAFLRVTDGWRYMNSFVHRVWPTPGIAWFRQRNQEWIDAYVEPAKGDPRLPDERYLVYGKDQDSSAFRPEYLQTALEISDTGDEAILLLNPEIVTPEGEWEAWFFANWLPGAIRCRSFAELMQQERQDSLELQAGKKQKAGALPRRAAPSGNPVRGNAPLPWWRAMARSAARILVGVRRGTKSRKTVRSG